MIEQKIIEFLNKYLPEVARFAFKVLLAFVVFWVGTKVIKWIRKVVKRSLKKMNVDRQLGRTVVFTNYFCSSCTLINSFQDAQMAFSVKAYEEFFAVFHSENIFNVIMVIAAYIESAV